MAVREIPVSGHLTGTGSQELRNLRLWQLTGPPGSPTEGVFWFDSDVGDKRIYFYDSVAASAIAVPRLDRNETVTGQYSFTPGSVQAPFVLGANAQGQKVTGFNADQLDGFDSAQAATVSTVAVRDASAFLAAAKFDASISTASARLGAAEEGFKGATTATATSNTTHKNSPYISLTSSIWNGSAAQAKGMFAQTQGISGTNSAYGLEVASTDTSYLLWISAAGGISVGTQVSPGAGVINANVGFRVANAATSGNYLRGDGTNFISATLAASDLSGTVAIASGGTGATTAATARTNLDVLWSDDSRRLIMGRATRGGLDIRITSSNAVSGTAGINAGLADFTIAGVIQWDDYTPSGSTIFFSSHSSGNNRFSLRTNTSGAFLLEVYDGAGAQTDYTLTPDVALEDGKIYQFVITADRDGLLTLYVNGISDRDKSGAGVSVSFAGSSGVNFGSGNANAYSMGNTATRGVIYATSVFNRALSAAEALNSAETSIVPRFADQWGSFTVLNSGTFTIGKRYRIVSRTDGDFTTVGSANNTVGTEFVATGTGAGILDAGDTVVQIGAILQLDVHNANPAISLTVRDRSSNANHGTAAASNVSQILGNKQLNTERIHVSELTTNSVLYSGSTGLVTPLALNSTSTLMVLTQISSGAPAWTNLYGTVNTWTAANTFSSSVTISGLTQNAIVYAGSGGLITGLGLNNTATVKFLTQVSSGVPVWTDLYAATNTWTGANTFNAAVTVPTPTTDFHAATKAYVDGAVSSGLRVLAECAVATTANITLSGEQTIDGILTSTSSVLVKNQTAPAENGIYVSAAGAWSRRADCDSAAEITAGAYTFVSAGTANAGTSWTQTLVVTTIGTDPVSWVKFFQQAAYVEGAGIDITGQTISVDVSFSPTWSGTHTFDNTINISALTQNNVLYAGASGAVTGLAVNASATVMFLTQVSSGAPVWTDLYAGAATWTGAHIFRNSGGVKLEPYGTSAGNTTSIRFYELVANGSNFVGFKAADTLAGDVTWTLPVADGSANYYLKTNGSAVLSFAQIASSEISNTTFVTAVSGTPDRITVTGTLTPGIDIAATYVGQTSITTLGTITTGTWSASTIATARGGTNNTTWATGDIVYASSTSALSGLSISGTADRFLSSNGTTPAWSGYTLPATVAANQLLYGSSGTAVSALATAASRLLTTDASGNIAWTSTLPAGVTVAGDATSFIAKIKWFDVGDGASATITLTHNFGTRDVVVEVYETASGYKTTLVPVGRTTTTTVDLEFVTAPGVNAYRAAVLASI